MEEMCVLLHWRDRLPPANKELAERSLDVGALVTLWEGGVKPMRRRRGVPGYRGWGRKRNRKDGRGGGGGSGHGIMLVLPRGRGRLPGRGAQPAVKIYNEHSPEGQEVAIDYITGGTVGDVLVASRGCIERGESLAERARVERAVAPSEAALMPGNDLSGGSAAVGVSISGDNSIANGSSSSSSSSIINNSCIRDGVGIVEASARPTVDLHLLGDDGMALLGLINLSSELRTFENEVLVFNGDGRVDSPPASALDAGPASGAGQLLDNAKENDNTTSYVGTIPVTPPQDREGPVAVHAYSPTSPPSAPQSVPVSPVNLLPSVEEAISRSSEVLEPGPASDVANVSSSPLLQVNQAPAETVAPDGPAPMGLLAAAATVVEGSAAPVSPLAEATAAANLPGALDVPAELVESRRSVCASVNVLDTAVASRAGDINIEEDKKKQEWGEDAKNGVLDDNTKPFDLLAAAVAEVEAINSSPPANAAMKTVAGEQEKEEEHGPEYRPTPLPPVGGYRYPEYERLVDDGRDGCGNDISAVANAEIRGAACEAHIEILKAEAASIRHGVHPVYLRQKVLADAEHERRVHASSMNAARQVNVHKQLYELRTKQANESFDWAMAKCREKCLAEVFKEMENLILSAANNNSTEVVDIGKSVHSEETESAVTVDQPPPGIKHATRGCGWKPAVQNIFQLGVKPARSRGGGKGKSIKTRNGGKNTDVDPYRPDGMPEPGPPEDAHISAAKKKNWEHMKGPMAGNMFFKLSEAAIDSDLAMLHYLDGKKNDKDSSSAQGRDVGFAESGIPNPGDGDEAVAEEGTIGGNGGRRSSPVPSGASRTSSMPELDTVNGGGSSSSSSSNENSIPGKRKRRPVSSEDALPGVGHEAGDGGASTRSKKRSKNLPNNGGSGEGGTGKTEGGSWAADGGRATATDSNAEGNGISDARGAGGGTAQAAAGTSCGGSPCDLGNRASTHSTNRRQIDGRGAGNTSGGGGGVVGETLGDGGDGTGSGKARGKKKRARNDGESDVSGSGDGGEDKGGAPNVDGRSRGYFSSKDSKRTRTNAQ